MRTRILAIDDEALMLKVYALLLCEYDVLGFSDPDAALADLRSGNRYAAVLLDMRLPGTSGMEVFAELKRIDPDQADRLIVISGADPTYSEQAFLSTNSISFLTKPILAVDLKASVRAKLRTTL